jgi:hypothetical protein
LDEVRVSCDASRHFTGAQLIEVSHVLSQDRLKVVFADLLGDVFTGVDEADSGDVYSDDLDSLRFLSLSFPRDSLI